MGDESQPARTEEAPETGIQPPKTQIEPYAWYLLGILMLVYIFNFVDRQLLTILAPELKRDLGISDSDFGFLYGTAFGVFYALFGIPLGKLADRWLRVRILAMGLALWSLMTALSGLSRNFGELALARVGVGIGEATLTPCTYSLVSDYFPPHRRATALGLYSTGLYLGTGISLFVGSNIVVEWDAAFPGGNAPLGLVGWQVAFLAMGLPGLLLALWVATLREPRRGAFDFPEPQPAVHKTSSAWTGFVQDLGDIVPPFTFFGAARRSFKALLVNLGIAAAFAVAAAGLIALTGDWPQWIAFAIGCYAIASWIAALRHREPAAFTVLFQSKAFMGLTIGYASLSFLGYANFAFSPLYAIQELGADQSEAGFMLGSLGALGGSLGVIGGGILADRVARDGVQARRIMFIAITAAATMICHAVMFSATSLAYFYPAVFITLIFMSASLGGSSGALVNIVPPQLRGTATAAFLLATNMIGLALGPYCGGKLSELTGDLGTGMLMMLIALPVTIIALMISYRALPKFVPA